MFKSGKGMHRRMVAFTKDATISASKLTRSSQKNLSEMMEKHESVGVILNDEISYAIIRVEALEEIMAQLDYFEEMIEKVDDLELAKTMGTRLEVPIEQWERVPEGQSLMDWYKGEE